jgi:hypothetical protein
MTKLKKCFLACLLPILITLGLLGYSAKVYATPIIDFAVGPPHPTTASIYYAGGVNPLVGVDLSVFNVVGIGTPINSGTQYNILNGHLDFQTGNITGSGTNTWSFAGGGYIKLYGGVDFNNNGVIDAGEIPLGTLLLSGTFSTADVTAYGSYFKISGASFYDTKDKRLTDFFGLPNSTYDGNFNISFLALGLPPNGFSSIVVGSGDVINSPVPEPATMLLFGCGLVGIGIFARRKFHRA